MKRLLERAFVVEAAAERAWAELVVAEVGPPDTFAASTSPRLGQSDHVAARR
jgi:hypothetical protein